MIKFLIFGSNPKTKKFLQTLGECIQEKSLNTIVCAELCDDAKLKDALGISQDPTLVLEESSLDYRDILIEWEIPNKEDTLMLLDDIFGTGGKTGGCSSGGCAGCHGGCQ